MILLLSYLVKSSIYRVSAAVEITYEIVCNAYVRQLIVSL